MKAFFDRQAVELEAGDVGRYASIVTGDLGLALKARDIRVHLLDHPEAGKNLSDGQKQALASEGPVWDEAASRLHLPAVYRDRALAVISVGEMAEPGPPEEAFPLLMTLLRQSLEKVHLYKINITDQETGLYNESYLRAWLGRAFEAGQETGLVVGRRPLSLGEAGGAPALTLVMIEVADFSDLVLTHGRIQAARVLRALADCLTEAAPEAVRVARPVAGRLAAALLRLDPEAASKLADKVQEAAASPLAPDLPKLRVGLGLAFYPLDFLEDAGPPEPADAPELVELLFVKAELALAHALEQKDGGVVAFRDIVQTHGRVVQVLPLGRVVVNLGRLAGAKLGQVFSLRGPLENGQALFKGEMVLADVQEDFAVGEMIRLPHSLSRVRVGDTLTLSQAVRPEQAVGRAREEAGRDELLGIPDHQGLVRLLEEEADKAERFALLLLRLDGYDRFREIRGRLASDQLMKALLALLQKDLPDGAVVGRFSADSLAVFCPDMDEATALNRAEAWQTRIAAELPQTVSVGLAVHPRGPFASSDVLSNAQKALDHASFFGHGSRVAFDAVSLNISGDRLYEAGDVDGAVSEYKKALELTPQDVNVLNSLGVCHGCQGRLDEALSCFARVMALEPENLMAHFNQGYALAMADRHAEALSSFNRAAGIAPDNFEVLFQQGKTALAVDRTEEAVASLERAAALADARPVVHRHLGEALLSAGRHEDALRALQAAVRADPRDASSMSQLSVLFLDRGTDTEVALSLARQSVALDPTNTQFIERLARTLAGSGDLAGAEAAYRQALERGVKTREVFYQLGCLSRDMDRADEARTWFERAIEADAEYKLAREALDALG